MEILPRLMFLANVLLAGWISITSIVQPKRAVTTIFENTIDYSDSIRLVGCLWFGIFILSIVGLFLPNKMNLVFLFQFIYKGTWLVVVALPLLRQGLPYPKGMATCFLAWVIILPFVIDWQGLLK